MDEMAAALGGRASEEIIFGQISTGALNDLEKVTKQAYAMISYFGMSEKIGNISFYDSTGQSDFVFNKPYSEKTAELIDSEVKRFVEKSYEKAKEILMGQKKGLTKLAELLLEKEVIFSEDLEKIFGKRKVTASFEEEKKSRAVKKEMPAAKSKTKKEKHVSPKVIDGTNKKPDTK
jgi:cell division protease FtsH